MKKLLFVCSSNLDRSPAAESLFDNNPYYEAKSCGILPHAGTVISKDAIKWADIIFCMEDEHKRHIIENFRDDINGEIKVLNISNDFMRNDSELERVLREKLNDLLW